MKEALDELKLQVHRALNDIANAIDVRKLIALGWTMVGVLAFVLVLVVAGVPLP